MDDPKQASREAFAKQAATYDTAQYGRHARWLAPDVLAAVAEVAPASLLDVGCGTGALLEQILKSNPAIEVHGLDLSPEMLAIARRRLGDRADLRVADAEALPLEDAAVDLSLCVDSFHHYPHPDAGLAEMRRVTRPGGTVIVADWHLGWLGRRLMNAVLPHVPGGDVRIYGEAEMRELCVAAGLRQLRWAKAGRRAQIAICTV